MMKKSAQEPTQCEDKVILYNTKDKKEFFSISNEEARFIVEIIKQRRNNTEHFCHISPLKKQKWFKNLTKKLGNYFISQHVSTLQIEMEDGYCIEMCNSNNINQIMDKSFKPQIQNICCNIINNPIKNEGERVKQGFLNIMESKIQNDLNNYLAVIDKMAADGKIIKGYGYLQLWEIASKLLERDSLQYIMQTCGNEGYETIFEKMEKVIKEINDQVRQIVANSIAMVKT